MFHLKNARLLKRIQITQNSLTRFESTQAKAKEDQIQSVEKQFKDGIKIDTKLHRKLPTRKPLAKNFFLGIVDKELLAFPEVITREDLTKLHEEITSIKSYFKDDFDTKKVDTTHCIPKQIKDEVKNLGLFGLNIGQHNGGKGYLWSESLIASESENISPDLSTILLSHRLVVDILNNYGTEYQKTKYIAGLANGSIVATEAIFESKISENKFFGTIATYDDVLKEWELNGEKSFVVNGNEANVFMVLAQTKFLSHSGESTWGITMFLVDSKLPGIKIDKNLLPFGCAGAQYCTINFEKTKLNEDNVVGKVNEGNEIAQNFFKFQRVRTSLLGFELTKKIINEMTEHCTITKQSNFPLKDLEIHANRLSKFICKAYAMESMIYFTSGLMDEFDNQDVDLEAAITKLYTMENLWSVTTSSLDFRGPNHLLAGQDGESNLRNAAQLYTNYEPMDSLRLFIVLTGLQHTGLSIYETVKKQRNPLFNPTHMFKKFLQKSSIENPTSKLSLGEHLHPSLASGAQCLERSIIRLQLSAEILLTRYGNEIVEKHVDLLRLTEMITLIYAMFTSLARSSRSYCIGLHLADHEMLIATAISLDARDRIKMIATEIANGPAITNDNNLQRLSRQLFKSKGCFVKHPLTFNY